MANSSGRRLRAPHFALIPSAGMGHIGPFCRLAVALSARGCGVTFLAVQPTVSSAESRHLSALFADYPSIRPLEFRLPELDASALGSDVDPFIVRFEAINRSAHLLPPLLASVSPPISALIVDIPLASACAPVAAEMGVPGYIFFISTALMFSLNACFPSHLAARTEAGVGDVDIPGLGRLPEASIPAVLHDPNNLFTTQFVENGRCHSKFAGILINTFEALEPQALAALNGGKVSPGLPPVIAVGPLPPVKSNGRSALPWLDAQPARSVVYVNFGNRTAMSEDQIKELGIGLERSGCRFLWVLKTKKVDREEEGELEELLGDGYLQRVQERGFVTKGWVEQDDILSHSAVGGFLSHCGSNSIFEAALQGVPILGWPSLGDQRVNAEVVASSGLGIYVREWSWEAAEPVKGEEIARRVRKLMEDEALRKSAAKLGEEAVKAVGVHGSSERNLQEFIDKLRV